MNNMSVVGESSETIISRLWERNYDPLTIKIIENLSIESSARCLDVGAGAGSMAYWLAGRADKGTVLAIDIDTSHLDAARAPNLAVKQMDITREEFEPAAFDFVLARGVFAQLPQPDHLLARATQWLAPRGWLVVEDFYFLPGEDAPTPTGRAVVGAYLTAFRANGADMRWARRLPANMAQTGLASVGMHVRPMGPGLLATDNDLMRARLELQGQPLVDNGLVTAEHLADFIASLDRPEVRDITTLEISAWGQRPAA